jgi:uncharacterized membrane protein
MPQVAGNFLGTEKSCRKWRETFYDPRNRAASCGELSMILETVPQVAENFLGTEKLCRKLRETFYDPRNRAASCG